MSTIAAQPFSGTYRAQPEPSSFALRGAPLRRLLVPRLAVGRRGNAARRRRRSDARGVRARRLHLRRRAGRDEGERARAGVLRRRAPPRDHVPLDGGSPRRRRAGLAIDGDLTIRGVARPVTARRSLRPTATGQLRRGQRGLRLRRPVDRRDFGLDWQMQLPGGGNAVGWDVRGWTSICCSCERTQMLTRDVLLVSGSLRRGSVQHRRSCGRRRMRSPSGVGRVWLDGIAALHPYDGGMGDAERAPAAVERLRRTIAAADAVLIATPEYNGSVPGGPQELGRLGIAPVPRQRLARQAGRGDRRQHGDPRHRLGTGPAAQVARVSRPERA